MKKPIPILYLDNTYTFGGAINSLLYLLRALDKREFKPILITGQPDDFLEKKFNFVKWIHVTLKLPWINNIFYKNIININFLQNSLIHRFITTVRVFYWFVLIILPEAIYYYRQGGKNKIKIIHLNNIFSSQVAGILAAKLLHVPCVAHLRKFEKVGFATKIYAKLIDHHIAISTSIKQNLINLDIPEFKISTIYDAIDLDDFNISKKCEYLNNEFCIKKNEHLFGIFGRVIEWKGIEDFVHAAALVCNDHPNSKGFIVGDISDGSQVYYNKIIQLIKNYGLEQQIILTGYRADIPSFMKRMDVVVHLSTSAEPFGMVLIEAMSMAKPVIATRIGGPLDIVENNKSGFFVDSGDYESAAKYIKLLINDPQLAQKIGNCGQDRVKEIFCKERYASEVAVVYMQLLNVRK